MSESPTEVRGAARAVPSARFTPGTVLSDRYRIVAPLGRGGMGEVYRADDLRLGQPVALKFLPLSVSAEPGKLRRLYEEIRLGRQVSHPNVCRIYDIVEWEGSAFITMEYIDGEDLASLLRRIGRLPHDKAVAVARDIAAGLAAAHALGVIHRDLKPANVMIDGRGNGRITDFGLAVVAEEQQAGTKIEGTPAYMAPEQFSGAAVTAKTDVYAFGPTVYEILTGRRLHQATSIEELRSAHGGRAHIFTGETGIEPPVQRLILRCLEEDPAARPRSMSAVLAAMPGHDQIQAALEAGETPSPEMLAAAGETGELKPRVAWPLLVTSLLLILTAYLLTARVNLTGLVPLKESPEALAFRARDVVARLNPGLVTHDSFHLFEFDTSDFDERVKAGGSFERAAALRPSLATFYYRQSPVPLVHVGREMIRSRTDPPLDVPGMAEVTLDPDGRLMGVTIVPPPTGTGAAGAEFDYRSLIDATGVQPDSLRSVAPAHTPPVAADRRYAWAASYPTDDSVRIEAATYEGKPVWFQVFPKWRDAAAGPRAASRSLATSGVVLLIVVLITACVLARRNTLRGRADTKAATRLAIVLAVASFAGQLVHIDHVFDAEAELALLEAAVGFTLLFAVLTWACYAAIEPYLRRRAPRSLVAWRRAIDGRFRDPLIGREMLVGVATGALVAVLCAAAVMLSMLIPPRATPLPPPP
ncbi:MAG TPA: serine/threonine-protein kinase, partial [Thermoanaerobaculia bacterium]|nr:serine/threonine-protein kinase [Thermoanaerobaculia bacterium]